MEDKSRRLRRYLIRERDIVQAFCGQHSDYYSMPLTLKWDGMPEDAVIERVYHDPASMCFDAIVSHESFEEVPEGQMIPVIHAWHDLQVDVLHRTEIAGQECYQFKHQRSPSQDWHERSLRHMRMEVTRLHPQTGDIIVVELPENAGSPEFMEPYRVVCANILSELPDDVEQVHIVLMPHGTDMRMALEAEVQYVERAKHEAGGSDQDDREVSTGPNGDDGGSACCPD